MRLTIVFILTFWIFSSCSSRPEGFEVSFNLTGIDKGEIVVKEHNPVSEIIFKDTVQIHDGKAVYKGWNKYPLHTYFLIRPEGEKNFAGNCHFFLDNRKISVCGDCRHPDNISINGSEATEKYNRLMETSHGILEKYENSSKACLAQLSKGSDYLKGHHEELDSLNLINEQCTKELLDYLLGLPGSSSDPIIAYIIFRNFGYNVGSLKTILEHWDKSLYDNPYVSCSKRLYDKEQQVLPGETAYDFKMQDIDGKDYRLSDYKGKYVLVAFSAYGCRWCKLQVPYLKEIYQRTDRKDLAILTINLDFSRKNWKKSIELSQLPWPMISDLRPNDGPAVENYNITGIPRIFLIDPEGKIAANNLRGTTMVDSVLRLIKK